MPVSMGEGKDWSLARFARVKPNTVTDVGPGAGTYATLFRPHHEGVWWTCIEVHKPYVRRYKLASLYDEVHVEDARGADDHLFHRDLVICGDVLEHMPREDAVKLLHRVRDAGAWHILVSLPIVEMEQGAVGGNKHETHEHHWDPDDMDSVLADLGGRVEAARVHPLGVWWWSR